MLIERATKVGLARCFPDTRVGHRVVDVRQALSTQKWLSGELCDHRCESELVRQEHPPTNSCVTDGSCAEPREEVERSA